MNRILLLEDDEALALGIEFTLLDEGYEVVKCLNVKEAVETFNSAAFDILILDVMLPSLNGMEVLRRLRQSSEVPVIMLTAKDEIMDNLNSQDAKNDNFHEKTEKSLLDIGESSMKYQKELLEVIDSFKNDLNEREKRLTEKEDELRLKIEELEKSQVESKNAAENNGGFFSKLFGRKQ